MLNSKTERVIFHTETKRRTAVKALLWRFIGVFWTWGGAYIIISLLPDNQKNALTIATLVTAWHHSTRMVMYYIYERIWTKVIWGIVDINNKNSPISNNQKLLWIISIASSIILIFWLLFQVTPIIKKNQKEIIKDKIHITVPNK